MQSRSETTFDTIDREKVKYLVTISASQHKDYIAKEALDDVIRWLKYNIDMHVYNSVYETSGFYKQLHWHAIVSVPLHFRYKPYTKWGSKELTVNTYQIQWKKITYLPGAIRYIYKDLHSHQTQQDILFWNYYSIPRFIA